MAVGGARQVTAMQGGQPASRSQMTVTLSGAPACGSGARLPAPHVRVLGLDRRRESNVRNMAMYSSCLPAALSPVSRDAAQPQCAVGLPRCSNKQPCCPCPPAADNRVYDGEVASQFLAAFSRHIANPYRLFQ